MKSRFKNIGDYHEHVLKMKEKGFSVGYYEHRRLSGIPSNAPNKTLYYASTDRNTIGGFLAEHSAWESLN